jgi:hypothetical protein
VNYLISRHRVENFETWYRAFASGEDAQRAAGLHLLHLLRDADDLDVVVMFFRVDDLDAARAYAAERQGARADAGVMGETEFTVLSDHSGR